MRHDKEPIMRALAMMSIPLALGVVTAACRRRATAGHVDSEAQREAEEQYRESMRRFPW